MKILFLAGLLCITTAVYGAASEPPIQNAPKVEPKQQAESAAQPQEKAQAPEKAAAQSAPIAPMAAAGNSSKAPETKSEQRTDEGSEFWPLFWGHRLKITDTIGIMVTFLVFLATVALWCSTDNLGRVARDQLTASSDEFKRSHRALVGPIGYPEIVGKIALDNGVIKVRLKLTAKNVGNSPAKKLKLMPQLIISVADARTFQPVIDDIGLSVTSEFGIGLLPGDTQRFDESFEVPITEAGKIQIWLVGYFGYFDDFDILRTSRFCYVSCLPDGDIRAFNPGEASIREFKPAGVGWDAT